jgi:uncharacterized protein YqgQ
MRLIDADELIKGLKEDYDDCDIQKNLEFFGIYDYIKEQPTAYDVDEVVEMLQECVDYPDLINSRQDYLHAIEIVKRGGLND